MADKSAEAPAPDLVERLRKAKPDEHCNDSLCAEAADTITALRAEVAAFKAGNRDLQLHFDVLKADYDNLTAENERLMAELRTAADMNVVYEGRLQEKEAENERLTAVLRAVMDDLTLIGKNHWLPIGLLDDVIYVNARAALEEKTDV